jgi:hypothetical protein
LNGHQLAWKVAVGSDTKFADGKETNPPVYLTEPLTEPLKSETTTGSRQLALILLSGRSGTGLIEADGGDDGRGVCRDAEAVVAFELGGGPESVQPTAMSITNAAVMAFIPKI